MKTVRKRKFNIMENDTADDRGEVSGGYGDLSEDIVNLMRNSPGRAVAEYWYFVILPRQKGLISN